MDTYKGVFIDGAWQPSTGDAMFPVINPYTEEGIGEASIGTAEDVDAAVKSAQRAMTQASWRATSLEERIAIVLRIKELMLERADELAASASADSNRGQKGDSRHFGRLRRCPQAGSRDSVHRGGFRRDLHGSRSATGHHESRSR